MKKQRGIIHHLPLFIIVVILAAGVYYLLQGKLNLPNPLKKAPKIELKTDYQNPFEKETQYVNPFEKYKNPFTVSK